MRLVAGIYGSKAGNAQRCVTDFRCRCRSPPPATAYTTLYWRAGEEGLRYLKPEQEGGVGWAEDAAYNCDT